MAAAKATDGEAAADDGAVGANRLQSVSGTGGGETTAAEGAEEQGLRGGNEPAIDAHGEHEEMLGWVH
jgi:hypothetical protein